MFQVVVRDGRKLISKQKFNDEEDAWAFYDRNSGVFDCEFRNLNILKEV